jgi:hypothetical protein
MKLKKVNNTDSVSQNNSKLNDDFNKWRNIDNESSDMESDSEKLDDLIDDDEPRPNQPENKTFALAPAKLSSIKP